MHRRTGAVGARMRIRHKLLFILMYFKLYPLQEVMGLLFGFNQSEANRWVHRLTPVLEKALGRQEEDLDYPQQWWRFHDEHKI